MQKSLPAGSFLLADAHLLIILVVYKNLMLRISFTFFFLILLFSLEAQGQVRSKSAVAAGGHVYRPGEGSGIHQMTFFQAIPKQNRRTGVPLQGVRARAAGSRVIAPRGKQPPVIIRSFNGNPFNFRVPNDNSIAVSKSGKVISVINASVHCYTEEGELQSAFTLDDMASTLGLHALKFDPRVIYDPLADRFIILFLNGQADSNSHIVLAFANDSDPAAGWNLYAIPASPEAGGQKVDFPAVSISADHLFISGNIFVKEDDGYQFSESVIWKVNKSGGYQGQILSYDYFDRIRFAARPFFSILPVNSLGVRNPNSAFFVANYGEDTQNDSVFVLKLLQREGMNDTMEIIALKADQPYYFPPLARQPGVEYLETNDARISGAFLKDGELQFVATTGIPGESVSGIYHGIVHGAEGPAPTMHSNIIHFENLYAAYPNIASMSENEGEKKALIVFNFSGVDRYPGFGAVFYDSVQPYSKMIVLKEGSSSVTIQPGEINRWGDYTGIQRDYSGAGMAWASGSYGRGNTHKTWISYLAIPEYNGISSPGIPKEISLFPNPIHIDFNLEFAIERPGTVILELLDANGKVLRKLFNDYLDPGQIQLSFSAETLSPGIYFVVMRSASGEKIATRKIIKL